MKNDFRPNYIKCPGCKNILGLSFKGKTCPNPLCGFDFAGLTPLLAQSEAELHKALTEAYRGKDERKIKLLATAVRYNIGNCLAHFVSCHWNAHYQTLFKDFILLYLDDLNALKAVLSSGTIRPDKANTIVSKGGYKMFPELYAWLMRVHYPEIRDFLRREFPGLYREWYKKIHKKLKKPAKIGQPRLV
jgi:hypothetical protein